jgi:hypothetical protein
MAQTDQSTTFSVLFSDLMMGAMGVIVVLIIFLQVTAVRGMSISTEIDQLKLPPGFREDAAEKFTKVRTLVCGAGKNSVRLDSSKTPRTFKSEVENGECTLKIYMFDNGIGNGNNIISSVSNIDGSTEIHVQVSISGYSTILSQPINRPSLKKDRAIVTINVKKEVVVYES